MGSSGSKKREHTLSSKRVLIVGDEGSGKNTVLKLLRILSRTGGFTDEELSNFKVVLERNVLTEMTKIVKRLPAELSVPAGMDEEKVRAVIEKFIKSSYDAEGAPGLTKEVARDIDLMWKLSEAKQVWDRRIEFGIQENIHFFLDRVLELAEDSYKPSDLDVLNCRELKTSGILDEMVGRPATKIRDCMVILVGKDKLEREEQFKDLPARSAIIYVVDLSSYDQRSDGTGTCSRLEDILKDFSEVLSSEALQKKMTFLVSSKVDLFRKKILLKPDSFKAMFPDFDQEEVLADLVSKCDAKDYKDERVAACLWYIKRKFKSSTKSSTFVLDSTANLLDVNSASTSLEELIEILIPDGPPPK